MSRTDYPVYLQLRDRLWEWIEAEQLSSQQRLPSERELSERFGTTRVTVRQALSQLEAEGLIFRSNRRGWYITPERLRYDPSRDLGFNRYVTEQGFCPRTETLFKQLTEVPQWLSEISGLEAGTPVYHVFRRRYVNERGLLVEHNYINPAHCPGLLSESTNLSIWQLLRDKYDLRPEHRDIEIYPLALKGLEAESLHVNQGTAGLYIQRLSFDQHGDFLELDREYWLHDALKISVRIGDRH
ncbi:UTRA domain-containing protein [Marinobacterium sediminicola]|uniref:DNA-binding transcriptional regulator, GntR family n=1 Tax=Marinobacterium sediminicola TaxID=518898 RepID=A0ABY1RYN8_9GAMM|nr:UTRA domain-containing protein [Marinobacterium sediminicola]ULG68124.1 UTRA domain-containing protein [Marinobacterium sediminicola]SMR73363.1 DNA-binding transcriptional regulator, GntR family [Marinobacterium sediminicola]